MNLSKRIEIFTAMFEELQSTTSTSYKQYIISTYEKLNPEIQDDWQCILEILAGKVKLGYTYYKFDIGGDYRNENNSIRDIYDFLREPLLQCDLSSNNIQKYLAQTARYAEFLEPLVNRKLRLGIGPSLLPKGGLSPMLGKKFEGRVPYSTRGYFVTEKLDGNRCIAYYDGTKWCYQSRNGKPMKVDFDMSNMPTDRVYDGEVLSPEQVELSNKIYNSVLISPANFNFSEAAIRTDFNKTSGVINSHAKNKKLIYNIFDIIDDDMKYCERRKFIDNIHPNSENVRILRVLEYYESESSLFCEIPKLLNCVTLLGGEGLMINIGDANYEHKRTNELLKYKEIQSMDMIVHSVYQGTGKYAFAVGSIRCLCKLENGSIVDVNVGSGLSDEQRFEWFKNPTMINGKIVEIEYFALSQSKDALGTNLYSMSFPRLKGIRNDKNTTSEY